MNHTPALFQALRTDHISLQAVLAQMRRAKDPGNRRDFFSRFRQLFFAYAKAVEKSVFAQLEANPQTDDEAERSYRGHDQLRLKLEVLHDIDPGEASWVQHVEDLYESATALFTYEEKELFPLMQNLLNPATLDGMAEGFVRARADTL